VVIEEVTEPAAADEQPPASAPAAAATVVQSAAGQREGLAESESDEDMPPLEEPAAPPAPAFPPGGFGMPGAMPPGMDAQRMQQAQEMFKVRCAVLRCPVLRFAVRAAMLCMPMRRLHRLTRQHTAHATRISWLACQPAPAFLTNHARRTTQIWRGRRPVQWQP